jgi:hypothetical protein
MDYPYRFSNNRSNANNYTYIVKQQYILVKTCFNVYYYYLHVSVSYVIINSVLYKNNDKLPNC